LRGGQDVFQTEAANRVRVSTAHFHGSIMADRIGAAAYILDSLVVTSGPRNSSSIS